MSLFCPDGLLGRYMIEMNKGIYVWLAKIFHHYYTIPKAIKHVKKKSSSMSYPETGSEALSKTEEDIVIAQLDKMFKNCDFCARVNVRNLIEIVRSGRFCSQTENTGTSNGTFDPKLRKKFSVEQYGCLINEKYGYACSFSKEMKKVREGTIEQYGNIIINFKRSSVDGKMTYYLGDSLAAKSRNVTMHSGQIYTHLGVVGGMHCGTTLSGSLILTYQEILEVAKMGSIDPFDYVGERNYLEIQFLGSLNISDISSIGFLHREDYDDLPLDVRKRLRGSNISVVFRM